MAIINTPRSTPAARNEYGIDWTSCSDIALAWFFKHRIFTASATFLDSVKVCSTRHDMDFTMHLDVYPCSFLLAFLRNESLSIPRKTDLV
jgi:hypothetical protein